MMATHTGKRIVEMVWEDLKPLDFLTPASFDNAVTENLIPITVGLQHQPGVRLRETGEVEEVAVVPVAVLAVGVAHQQGRRGQHRHAMAGGTQGLGHAGAALRKD